MHIETTHNPLSTCHLLRQSYWDDGKPKKRTIANLSGLPQHAIEALRQALKTGQVPTLHKPTLTNKKDHGAVSAILNIIQNTRLDQTIFYRTSRERNVVLAMLIARILRPGAKLRVERELSTNGTTTLAGLLNLKDTPVEDLYHAMDWLLSRQKRIEKKLAQRHVGEGDILMLDVSSSYLEGHACPLAQYGYSRDHRRDRPQVIYALLCTAQGCPIAIEAFAGNISDAMTLSNQVVKIRERFGLSKVVLVGDRGMISQARIDEDLQPNGFAWITALRSQTIRKLVQQGQLQPTLLDDWGLAQITSPDYPNERLVVCCNPFLRDERRRKRNALLAATEEDIRALATRYAQGKMERDEFNRQLGALKRRKMAKHFAYRFDHTTGAFSFTRKEDAITEEESLDGLYVIRTNVTEDELGNVEAVRAYKNLAKVERAFRSFKTSSLRVRPMYHWREDRVRSHLFLCLLAYYVEWHMRQQLAPLLFTDEAPQPGVTPVAAPVRSQGANNKQSQRRTNEGLSVSSFEDLLLQLNGLCVAEMDLGTGCTVPVTSKPTALQTKVFDLLGGKIHPAPGEVQSVR